MARPSDDLDEDYKSVWRKISQRKHPYDGVARTENDITLISAVANADAGKDALYVAYCAVAGAHPQADMKARLDLLMKNLQVTEH